MRAMEVDIVAEWRYEAPIGGRVMWCDDKQAEREFHLWRDAQNATAENAPGASPVTQVAECRVDGHVVLVMHADVLEPAQRAALATDLCNQFGGGALVVPVLATSDGRAFIDGSCLGG